MGEEMEETSRTRMELLEEIRANSGQKTFIVGQVSSKVFRYLSELQAQGLIEQLPFNDPVSFTYRLKA